MGTSEGGIHTFGAEVLTLRYRVLLWDLTGVSQKRSFFVPLIDVFICKHVL